VVNGKVGPLYFGRDGKVHRLVMSLISGPLSRNDSSGGGRIRQTNAETGQ